MVHICLFNGTDVKFLHFEEYIFGVKCYDVYK